MIEGNFKHLLTTTQTYLQYYGLFSQFDRKLAQRMKALPIYGGIEVPRKSFFHLKQYTGKTCANVMKIVVQVFRNWTRSHPQFDIIIAAWHHYTEVYYYTRLPSHDESTIKDMQQAIREFHKSLHRRAHRADARTLWLSQASQFNYPKFHAMSHYASDIREIGCLYNGDTQPSEAMHAPLKEIWRDSCNHRENSDEQILRVFTTREELKIFTDAVHHRLKPAQMFNGRPRLTSAARHKYSLEQYTMNNRNKPAMQWLCGHLRRWCSHSVGHDVPIHHIQINEHSAVTCDIEALKDGDQITLRARVTDHWGHSTARKERQDFIALYSQRATDADCYGIARVDIARLVAGLQVRIKHLGISFDVVFVELWQHLGYAERDFAHKYRRVANPNTGYGYAIELVDSVYRPVHMTPRWEDVTGNTWYLNTKTDMDAWMQLY